MTRRLILGLDGLSQNVINTHSDLGLEWHTFSIDTISHTCPSWNAIFSGRELDGVYDFWKTPSCFETGKALAPQSNEMYAYEELRDLARGFVWDVFTVEVVSVPVVLPAYSTVWDEIEYEYCWPSSKQEVWASMDVLGHNTSLYEDVICVFPTPDKPNHLLDNSDVDYSYSDYEEHMNLMFEWVDILIKEFDEYVILSDHGDPSNKEFLDNGLWVASHDPIGVITSNCMDVSNIGSNLGVYDKLGELFT